MLNSCIILYFFSFKHGPSPCYLLGKLRRCSLEDMGWFLLDILHEPNSNMVPSELGMRLAPQAHGGGLITKISAPKEILCSGCLWPKVSVLNHFCL